MIMILNVVVNSVSIHYPVLRNFLHGLYSGMKSHMYVATIDNALSAGDFHSLMEITNLEFYNLFIQWYSSSWLYA